MEKRLIVAVEAIEVVENLRLSLLIEARELRLRVTPSWHCSLLLVTDVTPAMIVVR